MLKQQSVKKDDVIPEPLRFEWNGPSPGIALCYPPGRHPEWTPQAMAPYLTEARELGIHTIYMPFARPANGLIRPKEILTRTAESMSIKILFNRDIPMDGIGLLKKGEGFGLVTGGCGVNIISTPRGCIKFHGARESWINRYEVIEPNMPESITTPSKQGRLLKEIIRFLEINDIEPTQCHFYTLGNIPAECFPHPSDHPDQGFADYNSKLPDYLDKELPDIQVLEHHNDQPCLNMTKLALGKVAQVGFAHSEGGMVLPTDGEGGYVHTGLQDEKLRKKRNLFLALCV